MLVKGGHTVDLTAEKKIDGELAAYYGNNYTSAKKSLNTVLNQSRQISNPENFSKLKSFIEKDFASILGALDIAEAKQKNKTVEVIKETRQKQILKHKKLLSES